MQVKLFDEVVLYCDCPQICRMLNYKVGGYHPEVEARIFEALDKVLQNARFYATSPANTKEHRWCHNLAKVRDKDIPQGVARKTKREGHTRDG